jgi:hypothetical protein
MSAPTVALQESTILEYTRRLQLPTLGRQFSRLAEEAANQNQTHLSYLEILLESELEGSATQSSGALKRRAFRR